MGDAHRPRSADRIMIVLYGLMAAVPLLGCPLLIWHDRPWAPSRWVDAALYLAAAGTAAGVLLAVRRPAAEHRVRWASALTGGAVGLTAVTAGAVFFGGSDGVSSGVLLLGAVVPLLAVRRLVSHLEPQRS